LKELFGLLLHGKKVSEGFIENWMGMETERIRRVLKMHPEFQKLSDHHQQDILRTNQVSVL
jgi:hypothetical protein